MSATTLTERLELPITGMTCASCANRIERKLNKLDGVTATVNYATETASIEHEDGIGIEQLIAAVEGAGYHAALATAEAESGQAGESDPAAGLRTRLIISAALSVPVLLISMISALQFDNWQWLSLQLATPVVLWGAWPFHRAAWANLKHATATMDTLISVGTLSAWLWSLYALFLGNAGDNGMRMVFNLIPSSGGGANEICLETASIVTTFILTGRYFEARAKRRAGAAPKGAARARGQGRRDPRRGRRRAPCPDRAAAGRPAVHRPPRREGRHRRDRRGRPLRDRHEHAHRRVDPGRGRARLRDRRGDDQRRRTTDRPRHPHRGRHRARPDRPPRHRGADRQGAGPAARRPDLRDLRPDRVHDRCRDARLLARHRAEPNVRVHRRGRRADHRLPLRARARHPDRADGRHRSRRAARAADQGSGDPRIDTADRHDRARQDRHRHHRADDPARHHRYGRHRPRPGAAARRRARGRIRAPDRPRDRHRRQGRVAAARRRRVHESRGARRRGHRRRTRHRCRPTRPAGRLGIHLPPALDAVRQAAEARGQTAIAAGWDGQATAVFVIADAVKPTSVEAIRRLKALGLRTVPLTGDNATTARTVANEVGIDEVIAEVMPADKAEVIGRLQAEGRVVAMAGDGVNDAPALARADLGLSIGTGTDVAIEASDLTLVSGDLGAAADAIRLSRCTLRTIKQNLGWAFGYNLAALPLAAIGLLNPVIASAAMAFSSLSVVANALRLRRFRSLTMACHRLRHAGLSA